MYSVALLMALTAPQEAPECFFRSSCCSYPVSYGCGCYVTPMPVYYGTCGSVIVYPPGIFPPGILPPGVIIPKVLTPEKDKDKGKDKDKDKDKGKKLTPDTGDKKITPDTGDKNVTPGTDDKKITPATDDKKITPDTGDKKITPGTDDKKITPDTGDKKITPGTGDKKITPDGTVAREIPAILTVSLPADAKLTVDGGSTRSQSSERQFVSPPLTVGRAFSYTLEATIVRDGVMRVQKRLVKVEAGKASHVTFDFPDALEIAGK